MMNLIDKKHAQSGKAVHPSDSPVRRSLWDEEEIGTAYYRVSNKSEPWWIKFKHIIGLIMAVVLITGFSWVGILPEQLETLLLYLVTVVYVYIRICSRPARVGPERCKLSRSVFDGSAIASIINGILPETVQRPAPPPPDLLDI